MGTEEKNEAAVALGRLGGRKGGDARAAKMSPEERSASARQAAEARWGDELKAPKVTHAGVLKVGDLELPCFVLEGGIRVLSQSGMSAALGMSKGGGRRIAGDRIANFLAGNAIKSFVPNRLTAITNMALNFRVPQGGGTANGYRATLLADICEVVLAARRAGAIGGRYSHIADRCEILLGGFARVGIEALVDEATGFQADRAKDALARILEEFIAKDLRPWVKTFPTEYYKELFRLRGWEFTEQSVRAKPPLVGKLTNNIVYKRLAPGVLEELRRVTPRDEKGRAKHKYHQRLTEDRGSPKLAEHLVVVTAFMRACSDWSGLEMLLDKAIPQFNHTRELDLGDA